MSQRSISSPASHTNMKIPTEIEASFDYLTHSEIEELRTWFAHLPVQDEEVRRLISDNIELLVGALKTRPAMGA